MQNKELSKELSELQEKKSALSQRIYEIRKIQRDEMLARTEAERKKLIGKYFVFSAEKLPTAMKRAYTYSRHPMQDCIFKIIRLEKPESYDAECIIVDSKSIGVRILPLFAPISLRLMVSTTEPKDTYLMHSIEITEEDFQTAFLERADFLGKQAGLSQS